MYVILVYDVDQKRTAKMLKLCRRYLSWIHNSVFEGEISEVQLKQLTSEARNLMDEKDSLIFFKSRDEKWLENVLSGLKTDVKKTLLLTVDPKDNLIFYPKGGRK